MNRMVPKGFADDMLECMIRRGIVPGDDLQALARPGPGQDALLVEQLASLWRGVAAAMNDEFLGRSQRPMPVGSFRLMCYCVLHAGTLKTAIPRALSFLQIVLGNLSATLIPEGGTARIALRDSDRHAQAFAHRMYWILIHGLSCWLVGRRLPLKQVDFACKIPAREADYRLFFGARVRFEQKESCLIFDERYLDLPIRRSEAELKAFLRAAPSNILVRYRQESDLTTKVSDILRSSDPEHWPTVNSISRRLGLSPASLRRHLAYEGQCFQAIKDDIRKHLACTLLAEASLSIAETSAKVGFKDPGAFYRAFRKWTGTTPRSYRPQGSRDSEV